MRVGIIQEGDFTGTTMQARYREMINEVILADKLGFYSYGTSEQHFSPPTFSVSAPEILYSAMAENTKDIIFRIEGAVLVQYNHPVMIAERAATLDIISGGRFELGTARSNNKTTLNAFNVPIETTQQQWTEGIDILRKAFTEEELEYDGQFWKVGKCQVIPKPVQQPFPPMSVAATSIKTNGLAGEMGIGVIAADSYFGYDYVDSQIRAYAEGQSRFNQSYPNNDYFAYLIANAFCAETRDEALRIAESQALTYFQAVYDLYAGMSSNAGYEYMSQIEKLAEHGDDIEFIMDHSPMVILGTPEDFITKLKDLEARGVNEVVMRIDGFGHDAHMQTIELIGKEVIPNVPGNTGTAARAKLLAAAVS
jgi:alkanesulfonate monooxygenase SsuD/methylene tetrahydromethanopterin reductase-like flavin-dependent oxidoreductase (luciferase family)